MGQGTSGAIDHTSAAQREQWLADHGLTADPTTLLGGREVLRNRLALAFDAGWDAARERYQSQHELVRVTAARVIIEVVR